MLQDRCSYWVFPRLLLKEETKSLPLKRKASVNDKSDKKAWVETSQYRIQAKSNCFFLFMFCNASQPGRYSKKELWRKDTRLFALLSF